MTQIRHNDGQEGAGISYSSVSLAVSPGVSLSLSSRIRLEETVKEDRGNKENARNFQKQHLWLGMSVFPSDRELRHNVVFSNWKAGPGWAICCPPEVLGPEEREGLCKELLQR